MCGGARSPGRAPACRETVGYYYLYVARYVHRTARAGMCCRRRGAGGGRRPLALRSVRGLRITVSVTLSKLFQDEDARSERSRANVCRSECVRLSSAYPPPTELRPSVLGCGSGLVGCTTPIAGAAELARRTTAHLGVSGGPYCHASTVASAAASRDISSSNWPPAPPLLPLLPLCGSRQPQSCGDNLDAQSAPSGQSGGKRALLLLVWVDSGDGGGGRRNWTGPHRKPRATT